MPVREKYGWEKEANFCVQLRFANVFTRVENVKTVARHIKGEALDRSE